MQIVHAQKWLFTMLLIFSVMIICGRSMQINSIQNKDYECRRSFDNILTDLRNNWQSPISYLQTRGYIPQTRDRTFNIKFLTRDERVKEDGGKPNSNNKVVSSFNQADLNKEASSNGAKNNLNSEADNSADNNIDTNVDTSPNNNLNNNLITNSLNNNLNTKLNRHLNTDISNNLNLNSELNTNQKMDTFPSANSIAMLNADTMSNISPISNLNNSPNLINELNTNTNLNSYGDLASDLNQPPTVQTTTKTKGKNDTFLHNVKNKFLGFFRGKSDSKGSSNRKSAFTYDIYNDFSDALPKELVFSNNKHQDISKLYGKASDPEIERIIQRGLKKDNEYDKEFISSTANKDLLSRLGKY